MQKDKVKAGDQYDGYPKIQHSDDVVLGQNSNGVGGGKNGQILVESIKCVSGLEVGSQRKRGVLMTLSGWLEQLLERGRKGDYQGMFTLECADDQEHGWVLKWTYQIVNCVFLFN